MIEIQPATLPVAQEASLPQATNLIRHGTHLVDLILHGDTVSVSHYARIMRGLCEQIDAGSIPLLNEKFDGSPAIVLGFTSAERPFVAYKGGLSRKGEQALITAPEDVEKYYRDDAPLGKVLRSFATVMLPRLEEHGDPRLLIQGDILFMPEGEQKRIAAAGELLIRANPYGITYAISPEHPLYSRLRNADCGVVLHSCAERSLQGERVEGRPSVASPESLMARTALLETPEAVVLHPFRVNVPVGAAAGAPLAPENLWAFLTKIEAIVGAVQELSPAMLDGWRSVLPKMATYLNSELYPGKKGGLYLAAAHGEAFDGDKLLNGFTSWISLRQGGSGTGAPHTSTDRATPRGFVAETLEPFLATHRAACVQLLSAYYDAVQLQYTMKPFIAEVYRSKLGGGPAEGAMFGSVKLVDRLAFTIENFKGSAERQANRKRGSLHRVGEEPLPAPFDRWRPGYIFYIGKFQPLHAGHVEAIHEIQRTNPGKKLIILASEKEPNLRAAGWKELEVGERKRDLQAEKFTYLFSKRFRSALFRAALGNAVEVRFMNPSYFWEYLRRAKREGVPGQLHLAVGEKEIAQARYQEQFTRFERHLSPLIIPAQAGGVAATGIREALLRAVKNGAATTEVEQQFAFIEDSEQRQKLVQEAVRNTKKVAQAVQRVLKEKAARPRK